MKHHRRCKNSFILVAATCFILPFMMSCSSGSAETANVTAKGVEVTVSGTVNTPGAATTKAVQPAAENESFIYAINAQDGSQLGSTSVNADGSFSKLSFKLPSEKSILVFKTTGSHGNYRTVVPIDFSGFPLFPETPAKNPLAVTVNQETTSIVAAVSEKLGAKGLLGDTGATLVSTVTSYSDALQLIAANGGQTFVYRPDISVPLQLCDGNRIVMDGECQCPPVLPFWDSTRRECVTVMPPLPICNESTDLMNGFCVCPALPSPNSCKPGTQLVVSSPVSTGEIKMRCPKAQCVELNCPLYIQVLPTCPDGSIPMVIPTFAIERDFNGCPAPPRYICREKVCPPPACADLLCPSGYIKTVTPSVGYDGCPGCPVQSCELNPEYCPPATSIFCPAAPDCGPGKVLIGSQAIPSKGVCQPCLPCTSYTCVEISP